MVSAEVESSGPRAAARALRVLHLIESLGPGGAERLLHTNLKHLDPRAVSSTVVTVFDEPDDWAGPLRGLGVGVSSLGCRSLSDAARGVARLRAWLGRHRQDLVHTHLWAANVVGRVAGRLAGLPVLSSVHNPDHEPEAWDDGSGVPVWKRRLSQNLDRWSARFGCDRMLAVSQYVRRSAHRRLGFPLERIHLLYNPIDTESFAPPDGAGPARADLLRAHGLTDEGPLLLNVGRVTPQKGLLYAMRALPEVLARHPAARLVSLGSTSDRAWTARLEAEALALGVRDRVHFLGPQREVADFLRACDLFVFPSLYEGMGIALVEAMAAGRACVASDVGPIPEVVRHGADGWLVPAGEAGALAQAVNSLLDDPARRAALGEAARASALARFRPEPAARELAALYASMIGEGKTKKF